MTNKPPMKKPETRHACCNCNKLIDDRVHHFSLDHFDYALCIPCQDQLRDRIELTTSHTLALYFLLRKKGINAQLEKFDGFKTIDIAVVEARLNIEVDGAHHNTQHEQALADLKRSYHSFEKGYFTLRIPNTLLRSHPTETADYVANFVELGLRKRRS
jgi:very-short-patch-repair endonuclease